MREPKPMYFALTLCVALSACSERTPPAPAPDENVSYEIRGNGTASTGRAKNFYVTVGSRTVVLSNGDLTVGETKFGRVEPGEKLVVEADGRVTVNGEARHGTGPHGGRIVSFKAADCEILAEPDGKAALYLTEAAQRTALPVEPSSLTMVLKIGRSEYPEDLEPVPLDGESERAASRFRSKFPLPDPVRSMEGRAFPQQLSLTLTHNGEPETIELHLPR